MSEDCFTSQLLETLGYRCYSIKGASLACVFLYLPRVHTPFLTYLPVYLFLSAKTLNSTLKIPARLTRTCFHADVCVRALVVAVVSTIDTEKSG